MRPKNEIRSPKNAKRPVLDLRGVDSNAFVLLGMAGKVARRHDMVDWGDIYDEATKGDYNHLVNTLTKHFQVIL